MPSPQTQQTIKQAVWALRLVVSYSSFVLDIIQVTTAKSGNHGHYPPSVVSMLVGSLLQMIYATLYFARSGRGVLFRIGVVEVSTVAFLIWQLVSVSYTASQRYTGPYCGPSASNRADCRGVLKGVMGLGFSLVGVNLLQALAVFNIKRTNGATMKTQMCDVPPKPGRNADLEQARVGGS